MLVYRVRHRQLFSRTVPAAKGQPCVIRRAMTGAAPQRRGEWRTAQFLFTGIGLP
jgi:hypothetical protein